MRNPTLHDLLETFATDAAAALALARERGAEVPFEVAASRPPERGGAALYCYRPLTGEFIGGHLDLLGALPSYAPAAGVLRGIGGLAGYLQTRGQRQLPEHPDLVAKLALRLFLERLFEDHDGFQAEEERFRRSYEELERVLYQGRCVTELVAPLLGIDLDPQTDELPLGDGLALVRPRALAGAPIEIAQALQPPLLLVMRVAHERSQPPSTAFARGRFRRVLASLRLYEKGSYAIALVGFSRLDDGPWSPVAFGFGGRPRLLTLVPASNQEELRGFCNLMARRLPGEGAVRKPDSSGAGEVTWALHRFELGCERATAFEALTDYLLALRALLEPEGPASGRLGGRLAAICAPASERAQLAARVAQADELEHRIITGMAPLRLGEELLIGELAEHLRAVLRDVICGHLDADVRAVADELLEETAGEPSLAAA